MPEAQKDQAKMEVVNWPICRQGAAAVCRIDWNTR